MSLENNYDYDLIVIGGGPAGEKGAAQAAYFGQRVALIEEYVELGGHCINWGTIASKTLRESALFLSGFRARQLGQGMAVEFKADISLANLMARTKLVQRHEQIRAAENLTAHGITHITGTARLLDSHRVCITHSGKDQTLRGRFILIATGGIPAHPEHIPFNPDTVFDSTTVLEMSSLPESMAIIGGGVIACEYACLFMTLGINVHLVHPGDCILNPPVDEELIGILTDRMHQMGLKLYLNSTVSSCRLESGKVITTLNSGKALTTATLLYSLGRGANTAGLGLDELGIRCGKYGHIDSVDPISFQTSVSSIYAAGDVIGPPALAATSMEQGRLAVCHAFGIPYKTLLAPILPIGIYTIPEIAQVGLTEQACRAEQKNYVVGHSRYGGHARGQIIGDPDGMIKLIFESPSGKLLGAQIIGELASELIHISMACLQYEGDIEFFIHSVFNYPTLSDIYKYAAYDALGKLNLARGDATPT